MLGGFTPGTAAGGPLSQLMTAARAATLARVAASGPPHRASYSAAVNSPRDKGATGTGRVPNDPAGLSTPRNFLGGL